MSVRLLIAILADDLIWATRIDRLVRDAGARTSLVRSLDGLERVVGGGSRGDAAAQAAVAIDGEGAAHGDGAAHEGAVAHRDAAAQAGARTADGVVVDMTSRAYDPIAAIRMASSSGLPVVAVAQHDDRSGREAARAAGAADVYAYGRLFAAGPRLVGDWVRRLELAP